MRACRNARSASPWACMARREGDERGPVPAHGLHVLGPGLFQAPSAGIDHILDHAADHAANRFVNPAALSSARMVGRHAMEDRVHERDLPQVFHGKEARAQSVVDVVVVVGDVVRQRGNLGLQAGMGMEFEVVPGRIGLDVARHGIRRARAVVLGYPFQGLPGQVQAVEIVIAVLQGGQNPHGLRVVIEAAVRSPSPDRAPPRPHGRKAGARDRAPARALRRGLHPRRARG